MLTLRTFHERLSLLWTLLTLCARAVDWTTSRYDLEELFLRSHNRRARVTHDDHIVPAELLKIDLEVFVSAEMSAYCENEQQDAPSTPCRRTSHRDGQEARCQFLRYLTSPCYIGVEDLRCPICTSSSDVVCCREDGGQKTRENDMPSRCSVEAFRSHVIASRPAPHDWATQIMFPWYCLRFSAVPSKVTTKGHPNLVIKIHKTEATSFVRMSCLSTLQQRQTRRHHSRRVSKN